MSIADDILVPTAALGGVGAAIDFYLGTDGQKRVKAWLEEKWYRFHDVNWHNFTAKEATAYVDFVDQIFGSSLRTRRRWFASFVFTLFCSLLYLLQFKTQAFNSKALSEALLDWRFLFFSFMLDFLAFAASISFSRAISVYAIRLTAPLGGALAFVLLLAAQYILIVVWRPAVQFSLDFSRMASVFEMQVLEMNSPIETIRSMIYFLPSEIWDDYIYSVWFTDLDIDWSLVYQRQRSALLSLTVNAIRFGFASLLLVSFVGRAWIGPIFSTTWARLVESEKPVFTITFGAVGAIATSLKEVVKLF